MESDYEFVQAPDGSVFMVEDKIAARTLAFTHLMIEATRIKDEGVYNEALEMLKRLRLSIPVVTEVQLGVVKGGRGN